MKREEGFTLVELLAIMAVVAVMLTIGAWAVRNFWLVRSLHGAQQEITTQLRTAQQQVMAESVPLVYGVGFLEGTNRWQIVQYNTTTGTCAGTGPRTLEAGVLISDVEFESTVSGVDTTAWVTACKSVINAANDAFVFFLPRGTATAGTVTVIQNNLDPARTRSLEVLGLSGKVRTI